MEGVQVIALAGVGSLGRYLYEVLSSDSRYSVIVLSRNNNKKLQSAGIDSNLVNETDYSEDSVLSILESTRPSTLISTIQCPDEAYVPIHQNLLRACIRSTTCKRFIPSEYAGNIEAFPHLPGAYGKSRAPFRQELQNVRDVEWTLVNFGWFMDYFVPEKTFIQHAPGEFPIDFKAWTYSVRGTGEEPQSWTCARDVARGIAELLQAPSWDQVTYIAGDISCFNDAAKTVEEFYGRPLKRIYRNEDDIKASLQEHSTHGGCEGLAIAEAEELTISGALCCPHEKALRQRDQYFKDVQFPTLRGLLRKAESVDTI